MQYRVPFYQVSNSHTRLHTALRASFERVLAKSHFILGEEVAQFEQAYAQALGVREAIGVSNGLDALKIALRCLDIGEGDEVLVPAHTFVATIQAVCQVGATPVLVEPQLNTYNLDVELLEQHLSPNTKALILVHLYGQAANLKAAQAFCKNYELYLIEDNAQAHLARYEGQATGSFGEINAASFYPTKNLGALGDAGIITTKNLQLAEKARFLRNYGSSQKHHYEYIGYNARLDELQAAFLRVKLAYLEEWNEARRQIAQAYFEGLEDISEISLPQILADTLPVFHLFVIRTQARDALRQFLEEQGIQTQIHYPKPVHLQTAYRYLGYSEGDLPISETLAKTCLSLPLFIEMSTEQQTYVIAQIRRFFGK